MNADKISLPSIFVAGAAHLDRRGQSAGTFRAGASNPGRMVEAIGGAAFNATKAMHRMGARLFFTSARGGDAAGQAVEAMLADLGIADHALTWLDRATPTYTALLDSSGDLVGGLADMALYDLLRPRVFMRRHLREALSACDALLLDANLPSPTVEHLLEMAGPAPSFAIGVSPAKVVRLAPVLARLDGLFLSLAEAAALCGTARASPLDLAFHLGSMGCRNVAITDGPRRSAIVADGVVYLQTPPTVPGIADVTGAGDTLAGTATVARLAGRSFVEAVRLGMAAASLHISAERRDRSFGPGDVSRLAAAMPAAENASPSR